MSEEEHKRLDRLETRNLLLWILAQAVGCLIVIGTIYGIYRFVTFIY